MLFRSLKNRGFNRVSMGVQDFDPEVQELVNRVQPFEMTKTLVEAARSLGIDAVQFESAAQIGRELAARGIHWQKNAGRSEGAPG